MDSEIACPHCNQTLTALQDMVGMEKNINRKMCLHSDGFLVFKVTLLIELSFYFWKQMKIM